MSKDDQKQSAFTCKTVLLHVYSQFLIVISLKDNVLVHYIHDIMLIEFGKQEVTNTLDTLEREMLVRCIQGSAILLKFPGV